MRRLTIYLIVLAAAAFMVQSCQYKYTIEPIVPAPSPNDTIYFSTQVVPIWTTGENCTQCHNTGGTAPDLTADNAYNSIIGSFVNVNDPESSMIYTYPSPDTDTHDWRKYSDSEAAIILQWIQQGALNN